MANAIDDSFCMLMCVSEAYGKSYNCHSEADYAYRQQTPIIPLIMQVGCQNIKGWLGFYMGSKQYVNFADPKYDFEKQIDKLVIEISNVQKNSLEDMNNSQIKESMTEIQVEKWFVQEKIDTLIVNFLGKCNGQILKQLWELRQSLPQFFYNPLKNIPQLNQDSIDNFEKALNKLFKN